MTHESDEPIHDDPLYVGDVLDNTQSSSSLAEEVRMKMSEVDAQVEGKVGETLDIIVSKSHEVLSGLEEAGVEEGSVLRGLLDSIEPSDNPYGVSMDGLVFKLEKERSEASSDVDKASIGYLVALADAVRNVATTKAVIEEADSSDGNEEFLIDYTNERIDELVTDEVARATLQAMTDSLK